MTNVRNTVGLSIAVLLVSLLVLGCGGKKQVTPLPVGTMEEYRDPQYGFHFDHPQGWVAGGEAGRPRIYNTLEAGQRFMDPTGPYPDGVLISVDVIKADKPAEQKASIIAELTSSGFILGQPAAVTIGGKAATKVPYTANHSAKIKETGHHIYVELDTVLYDIAFRGFGDMYATHAAIFDSVEKSFTFPRAVEPGRDATLPSDVATNYDAKMFTFQYPENFNFENAAKGNNDLALSLRGVRQDCSVQFIVFGAKGLTLEKVVDQNKGKYPGASQGKATIGGQPAITLTYSAAKEVERRVYFMVKDDKVYRVILDWFKPQRAEYLAAYDKLISSIKLK
jgi:hypothetical protein